MKMFLLLFCYIVTLGVFQDTHCLHLTSNNISVDISVDFDKNRTDVQLECHYELGDDRLYSIMWYKDGREFYRFYPHRSPMSRAFTLNGVNVDISKSNETVVFLTFVDELSSGSYRCDAYGDPSYTHVFQEIELNLDI